VGGATRDLKKLSWILNLDWLVKLWGYKGFKEIIIGIKF
jgi:hypothetical protein